MSGICQPNIIDTPKHGITFPTKLFCRVPKGGGVQGGGNWGTLRIPREDWGTLGNIRED